MRVQVISSTQQEFNGTTYYKCGPYFQRNGKRLHRAVWEHFNGMNVPKGYHVHHKDENRNNNAISNLELIPGSRHLSQHMLTSKRKAASRIAIDRARDYANEWHGSKEGREWHRKHAKKVWEKLEPVQYTCSQCGAEFSTLKRYGADLNRFCSNNCKSAWRRASGLDNVTRECAWCGEEFEANKYQKHRFCSKECRMNGRCKNAG